MTQTLTTTLSIVGCLVLGRLESLISRTAHDLWLGMDYNSYRLKTLLVSLPMLNEENLAICPHEIYKVQF